MKPLLPPTREEWGDLDVDPEVRSGYEVFGGMTLDEALPLFVENPIERAVEIHFAPAAVFNYYVFCFANFLASPESDGDSDAASVFLNLVRTRIAEDPASLSNVFDDLKPYLDLVAGRQLFYVADEDVYGNFSDLRDEIDRVHSNFTRHGA